MEKLYECPQCQSYRSKVIKTKPCILRCIDCKNVYEAVVGSNPFSKESLDNLGKRRQKEYILSIFNLPFLVDDIRKELGQPGPSKDYNAHFANPSKDDEMFLDTE